MTTKYEEMILAPNLTLRSVKWSDIKAVAQLILDVCTADGDPTVASTEEDIKRFWTMSDVHIETDVWIVETKDGKVVGYQEFYNKYAHAAMVGDGYVHPEYHGLGIGTA